MPRLLPKKNAFGPDDVVAAWQSFAVDIDGRPFTVNTSMRFRGDHPVVRACPWCFSRAGAPAEDVSLLGAIPAPPEQEETQ